MKKWIVRILVAVLVIGAFAAVGFVGYRTGFSHGAQVSANPDNAPRFAERFHRGDLPKSGFHQRDFNRGFPEREFQRPHRGGFGFFSTFMPLARVALLGLVIWIAYMLFKGNGWTLSLTRAGTSQTPPEPSPPVEAPAPKRTSKGKQ